MTSTSPTTPCLSAAAHGVEARARVDAPSPIREATVPTFARETQIVVSGHPYTLGLTAFTTPVIITSAALKQHDEPAYLLNTEWELRDANGVLVPAFVAAAELTAPLYLDPRPGVGA